MRRIRDETMLELGVQLEDRGDESVWKLEDPEVLRRAHQEKQQAAVEQKIKKLSMAHSKKDAVSLIPVPAAACRCHTGFVTHPQLLCSMLVLLWALLSTKVEVHM